MVVVRLVFQAKFGTANQVVAGFKQAMEVAQQVFGPDAHGRILTDLSGPFDTVVQEIEVASLAAWEQMRATMFAHPGFQEAQAASMGLIESGSTEFYTVEA